MMKLDSQRTLIKKNNMKKTRGIFSKVSKVHIILNFDNKMTK